MSKPPANNVHVSTPLQLRAAIRSGLSNLLSSKPSIDFMAIKSLLDTVWGEVETVQHVLRDMESVLLVSDAEQVLIGEPQFEALKSAYTACQSRFDLTTDRLQQAIYTMTRSSLKTKQPQWSEVTNASQSMQQAALLGRQLATE